MTFQNPGFSKEKGKYEFHILYTELYKPNNYADILINALNNDFIAHNSTELRLIFKHKFFHFYVQQLNEL